MFGLLQKYYQKVCRTLLSAIAQSTLQSTTSHGILGKGKTIPLKAWTYPEGSRRFRLQDFKTTGT